ncbi:MAG: ABC transporter permease [Promethearchaeota archaeon]
MKRQRVMALAKIQLFSLIRTPMNLALTFLLPVIIALVFGLAFAEIILPNEPTFGWTEGTNLFEELAPGLFAYSGLCIIFSVAQSYSKQKDQGILKRINTTPTTPSEFMASSLLTYTSISIIQVAIIGVLFFSLGYRPDGAIAGMSLAFVFMVIFSLSAIGFGLITVTISKNYDVTGGIVQLFVIPQQVIASGLNPIPVATQVVAMFMPVHYASDSITLLFNGTVLTDPRIWGNLMVLVIYCVLVMVAAIYLFKKREL